MSRHRPSGGATELSCPRCGSRTIDCERDAILLARVAELRDGVLAAPLTPEPLDDVLLACADCGAELEASSGMRSASFTGSARCRTPRPWTRSPPG